MAMVCQAPDSSLDGMRLPPAADIRLYRGEESMRVLGTGTGSEWEEISLPNDPVSPFALQTSRCTAARSRRARWGCRRRPPPSTSTAPGADAGAGGLYG
jgi:hypothetical protein